MMNYLSRYRVLVLIAISLLLLANSNSTVASSGAGYTIDWFEVNSGSVSTGGGFRLTGVAGQPDARSSNGGTYKLGGGFFPSPDARETYPVFLPLALRTS